MFLYSSCPASISFVTICGTNHSFCCFSNKLLFLLLLMLSTLMVDPFGHFYITYFNTFNFYMSYPLGNRSRPTKKRFILIQSLRFLFSERWLMLIVSKTEHKMKQVPCGSLQLSALPGLQYPWPSLLL